jgi:trk system potassium uptake protein TrkH
MSVYDLNESFIDGLKLIWGNFFTVFSFITTTGYVSSYWEEFQYSVDTPHVTMVLLGLCLFGGGLATTAGGIKLMRISILFSALSAETGKLTHPSSIHGTNLNLKNLEISSFMAWIFFMLFLVSLAVVTIVLSMFGMFFEDAVVLAVACLTSTGPLIDVVGVNSSMISELPYFSKLVLVASMILGRIEILLALSVINSALRRA